SAMSCRTRQYTKGMRDYSFAS
ncbi:hypothetical protein ACG9XQ_18190, partial [Acinetobacter baumannii]